MPAADRGVDRLRRPASESLQGRNRDGERMAVPRALRGIWPQRLKRRGVGEATDGKGGWLADGDQRVLGGR
jgi:hypothetical protein